MAKPAVSVKDPASVAGAQSVERALKLLAAFTDEQPEWRVSELGALTGLGQSTVSRLVSALEGQGYLGQDPRTGLYHLGRRVVKMAGTALNSSTVFRAARQVAQNLARDLDLGANVAERDGTQLFYLCHFEGSRVPRSFTLLGRGGALHATGMGKALIMKMSTDEIHDLIGTSYPAYTNATITNSADLVRELAESRARGYATEIEELALGRGCIAAPIHDRAGNVVAALSVSGPLSLIGPADVRDTLARTVIEHADQISIVLGYHSSAPPH